MLRYWAGDGFYRSERKSPIHSAITKAKKETKKSDISKNDLLVFILKACASSGSNKLVYG